MYISALGAAQFPFGTTVDTVMALSTGVVIIVSRLSGIKEKEKFVKYVKSAIFYNSLISFVIFAMWFFFAKQILDLLSVDKLIMDYCLSYIRICSVCFLFIGIDSSLQAMLQGLGNTKPIMYAGVLKVVLNVFFSWIFIFGHFGIKPMYIVGAALGTVVANVSATLMIIFYCFIVKYKEYGLHKNNKLWISFKPFKESIRLGIPTAMEFLLWNGSNLVLVKFLNEFSQEAMKIYTMVFGIEIIIFAFFNGTSRATLTLMGQKIGLEKRKEANTFFYVCTLINLIIVAISATFFVLFPTKILGIFTKEEQVISSAAIYLIFCAMIMFPKSLNVVIGSAIRAYKDTKWMLYSQIIGSIFVVSCSYFLIHIVGLDMISIFITLFLDEAIRACINYIYFIKHYRKI